MSSDSFEWQRAGFLKNLAVKYHTLVFALKFIPNWRVFWRFVRGYFRVNILGENQLRFVEIFVTLACNANCYFCSNGRFTDKKGNISVEKYLSIIDECARLNVPIICLIGGEPLLYKDLNKLIERINSHGIISMVVTNGTLLTEEKVKELAQCGLSSLSISLHSIEQHPLFDKDKNIWPDLEISDVEKAAS